MFRFDQAALPQITTRKALIIVDFQNDFIGTGDGNLPVTEPPGFVDRALELATTFRAKGDVVWVQSRFDKIRPVDSDQIIVSDDAPAPRPSSSRGRRRMGVEPVPELPSGPPDPEAFLSQEEPLCVKPSDQGCEMPLIVKEAIEKGDLTLTKTHYSAFQESHLLRMLRGKMVMEVFICGSLTNVGVYATALDAAGHGMTITVVEDCCGYRHESRQINAVKNLVELTGCDIASVQEVLDTIDPNRARPVASAGQPKTPVLSTLASPALGDDKNTSRASMTPDIVKPMTGLRLASNSPNPATIVGEADQSGRFDNEESPGAAQADSEGENTPQSLPEPIDLQKVAEAEPPETTTKDQISHADQITKDSMEKHGSESDNEDGLLLQKDLCEGDTDVIQDALSDSLAKGVFEKLQHEVRWQRMSHQGGEVPRLIAVQGEVADDGSMPIYRHPADESPPLLPFSSTILAIKAETEKHLGHPLNHVLIQYYRDGNDYISEHSDKTLDIVKGSYIANVSLGAERTMVLRTKRLDKDPSRTEPLPSELKRKVQRARLPHNSLCRMGLQTNMKWLHAIRQDKRADRDKSAAELAYSGGRISLTFRNIGTFLNRDETIIWGQGATGKTRDAARPIINGQSSEAVKMLQAFGAENHSSNFDWDAQYGNGFDVLHISNSPRLFASEDSIVNMRISLLLAECGITYAKGSMVATINSKDNSKDTELMLEALPIKFVDNDGAKSVIHGDIAIMLYLDSCYGQSGLARESTSTQNQAELAKRFTRFQQGLGLLPVWRRISKTKAENRSQFTKVLKRELAVWDRYASELPNDGAHCFMASTVLSLADFAVWPVLHAIFEDVGSEAFDGLESLRKYYQKIAALENTQKALGKTTAVSESK
ncbi:DNA oxidative demethylase ALKBH2 [Cladobotryum mycophilum]|uniref:DNA oxidative demethylase ALKBH2 n=1 Tax=Cladobotryum mycophilum TaxID=491253 RepID=A0ABR0SGW1_9HYPO